VALNRQPELRHGFQILPEFTVVQHERDIALLHQLRTALGCGTVRVNHGERYSLRVRKLEDLARFIVPFFEKNSLRSKKQVEFKRFARIIHLMTQGAHLTPQGAGRILDIALQMNRGQRDIIDWARAQLGANEADRKKLESMPGAKALDET
jgi:LAGLIDADG endonuclease